MRDAFVFKYVTLSVAGKRLDPEQVTNVLNIAPDSSVKKGDRSGKKGRAAKQGVWSIEGYPPKANIKTQIKNILRKLKPVHKLFVGLRENHTIKDLTLTVAVGPREEDCISCLLLDKDILNEIARYKIDLVFSIHQMGVIKAKVSEAMRANPILLKKLNRINKR